LNNAQLLSALQAKMAAEQEKFQDWLLTQSPEEILNHTFEYSTREDIVLLMDDIRLSNDDLKILLSSPTPLADVYKILSNTDTGLLDTIQACMEVRAGRMREAARHNSMAIPQRSSVLDKLQTKAPEAPKPPSPKKEHGAR
jgi:hypothetical protein